MELSTNTVLYETRNQIAYITLNRPESLNALSRELGVGLDEAMDEFRDDPDLLVAILIGSGGGEGRRAFSAGMEGPRAFLKERASLDAAGDRVESPIRGRHESSFADRGVFKPFNRSYQAPPQSLWPNHQRSTATASPEDWSCR